MATTYFYRGVIPNQAPSVVLALTQGSTSGYGPVTVELTANPSAPSGMVARVEFFRDSTSLGVVTASPYSLSFTAPVGTYNLTAVVTDSNNLTGTSNIISVAYSQVPTRTINLLTQPGARYINVMFGDRFRQTNVFNLSGGAAPDFQVPVYTAQGALRGLVGNGTQLSTLLESFTDSEAIGAYAIYRIEPTATGNPEGGLGLSYQQNLPGRSGGQGPFSVSTSSAYDGTLTVPTGTPVAPNGVSVNNSTRMGTLSPGVDRVASDYEFQAPGTTGYVTVTSLPFSVGNLGGTLLVRRKAVGQNPAGTPASVAVTAANTGPLRMAVVGGDSISEGFGLGANYQSLRWSSRLAVAATSYYGLVNNQAHSGDQTVNTLGHVGDIRAQYNFTTYSGVDVFILIGVNDFRAGVSLSTVKANLAQIVTDLKAGNPGNLRVYLLTLLAQNGYGGDSAPLIAQVTANINDLNADIRANYASYYGAYDFVDTARILEAQDPNNPTYFGNGDATDKLHPTPALQQLLANAVDDKVERGLQPTGPILSNPGSGYVEDPSLAAVPWTNPTLVPYDSARIELLSTTADGSRARATVEDGFYNNVVNTVQGFGEVSTNWIAEVRMVVQAQDEQVLGFSAGHVSRFGDIKVTAYKHNTGTVDFLREGSPIQPTTGSTYTVQVGDEQVYKLYKNRVEFWLNGVQKATVNRTETNPLLWSASLPNLNSIVAVQVRAYAYVTIPN